MFRIGGKLVYHKHIKFVEMESQSEESHTLSGDCCKALSDFLFSEESERSL